MKSTVKKIDSALRDLYRIDVPFFAEDFIVYLKGVDDSRLPQGTLFVQEEKEDLSLGIYFHPTIQKALSSNWGQIETGAFATATEEISHFLYLVYQANQGRNVSQFELELQGEIDKFLLLFFKKNEVPEKEKFESLYATVFEDFRWHSDLTEEQQERYQDANAYAKKFAVLLREFLCQKERYPDLMKVLRDYYRLSPSAKIGFLSKD